ncbi:MAG: cytochrome P450 [Deltaproteobacteria bacterium]
MGLFEPCGGERWRDPFPMYRALRDEDPVHHVEDGDYYVLSRWQAVLDAACNTETFSSAEGLTFTYGEREKIGMDVRPIVMMDPPEHTDFRRLVSKGFTPRAVAEFEPEVRRYVIERIEALRSMGEGDVIPELFKPLPSFVVAHYLGVPKEDRARFDGWTEAIVQANSAGNTLDAGEAVADLVGYFSELIDRRRVEPGDDAVSALIQAEVEGADVDILQVLGFAFTMVTGGNDTTTGLLGGMAELLTEHPDQRALLIEDPTLIPNALEECLRLTTPVQGLARTVTRRVEIDGIEIPEGRRVMLLYASANRDADEFGPTSEQCDVTRKINRLMTFTYGAHYCLGAAATRMQSRVVLEELLARCPDFTVDAAAGCFADGPFVRRYETLPFTARVA